MNGNNPRSGARVLVDQLLVHGVDTIFTVPGESFLSVLDALHDHQDRVRVINCRMEAGAANMAEAYGKLKERPGICMVTRGPGATHAAVGIHTAAHDATPMILFIGQVARSMRGRGAFQEVDFDRMFGSMAKWTVELDDPARIPENIARAFEVATSGAPGPVVVSMPEDILQSLTTVSDAGPFRPVSSSPSDDQLKTFGALLEQSQRPLIIAGGGSWKRRATTALTEFASKHGIPVAAAFRSQDAANNDSGWYVGDLGLGQNPKLSARVLESDLVIAAGTRLEETVTKGYTLLGIPRPGVPLVHVHPDINELGRVYQADLLVNSSMEEFFEGALRQLPARSGATAAWLTASRADYEAFQKPPPTQSAVDMTQVILTMRRLLPDDAIVTNGAGNYTVWLHRFFRYRSAKTQLAPTSGAMGYSVPAAVAAKIVDSGRVVVSVNGDGCFMMCGQELATAVQHDAAIVFIVVNNGILGTIRMHQERNFPGRIVGTKLVNPDFVALANAFGIEACRVASTEQFEPALTRALESKRSCLIEVMLEEEAILPSQTLSQIRKSA